MLQGRTAGQQKLLANDARLNFSCGKWEDWQRMLTLKKPGKSRWVSKTL